MELLTIALLSQSEYGVASVAPWISILTGSGGALAVLGFWVKTLLGDRKDMVDQHKLKDKQLVEITREAIECIRGSLSRADDDAEFRNRVERTLESIDDKLDTLS